MVWFSWYARKFLFKCNNCALILLTEFPKIEDHAKIAEDLLDLECQCGGLCRPLRD
jgi:hypothetical protein